MSVCPNKRSDEWKKLVEEHGEDHAYLAFIRNNHDFPKNKISAAKLLRPVIEASTPSTGADIDESRVPKSLQARDHPVEDIEYEVRHQDETAAEARGIINREGEESAFKIMNDRRLRPDTRVGIIGELFARQAAKMKDAKTPAEIRDITARMNEIVAAGREENATRPGQAVAMWNHLYKDQRVAAPMELTKQIQDAQDREIGEPGKEAIDEATKAIKAARKKAIDDATTAMDAAVKNIPLKKPIWDQYRQAAADRMLKLVEKTAEPPPEQVPLQEFTKRIVAEMTRRIKASLPKAEKPQEPTAADALKEMVENKEKYADVLTSVRSAFEREYGEGSPALDLIDTELADMGLRPYTKKLLDRSIKEAHDAMRTNLRELAKQHFTKTDPQAGDLADAIVKTAGVKSAEAGKLATDLAERTKELVADAREKAVERLKKTMVDKGRTHEVFDAIAKATELNNIGAFGRDDVQAAVAKALKLPRATPEQMQKIAKLADAVETAPNVATKARATVELAKEMHNAGTTRSGRAIDVATSIWYSNLLAGSALAVKTSAVMLNSVSKLATTAAANPLHIGAEVAGWLSGVGEGLRQAKDVLKRGRGGVGYDVERGGYQASENQLPRPISALDDIPYLPHKYVTRAFKAIQATFHYPAREAYARVVATKLLEADYRGAELRRRVRETLGIAPDQFEAFRKQAAAEGFAPEDVGLRVGSLVEQHRQQTISGRQAAEQGDRFGKMATYQQDPAGWEGVIYNAMNNLVNKVRPGGVPVLKPFMAFLKVPTNALSRWLDWSPVGIKRAVFGTVDGLKGYGSRVDMTADERLQTAISGVAGTMLMGGLSYAMMNKDEDGNPLLEVTGAGPKSLPEKKQLEGTGWIPYSVRIRGGPWISFAHSPLMLPLTVAGNVADNLKYNKTDDLLLQSVVADAVVRSGRAIFDLPMLQGMSKLLDFVEGKNKAGELERFLATTATSTGIPNGVRQLDEWLDPTQYKAGDGLAGRFKQAIPFERRNAEVQQDDIGETSTYSPTSRFVSPERPNELRDFLVDKNVTIAAPTKGTIDKKPMSPAQFKAYRDLRIQGIRSQLEPKIQQLQDADPDDVKAAIKKIEGQEDRKAKAAVRRMSFEP